MAALIRGLGERDARWTPTLWALRNAPWFETGSLPCETRVLSLPSMKHPLFLGRLRKLAREIRRGGFDLLHTFMADGAVYGPLLGRWARVPVITSRRDLGYWQTPRKLDVLRLVNRRADTVIANAEAVWDRTVATEWVSPGKVQVIGNGHDPARFAVPPHPTVRAELGIPEDARIVGLVANFRPLKRQADLVEALAQLGRKFADVHLLFLGEGDDTAVRACAAEHGLEARVHVLTPGADVVPYLRQMSAGALCSSSEGLSNAILEYMATGLPVVASAVGGNPELVDETNGATYPPGDIDALAEALRRVLADPAHARQLGAAGQARFAARFTASEMIRRTLECYDALLAPAPVGPTHATEVLEDPAAIAALEPEWTPLLRDDQFFQSPAWVTTWFETSDDRPCVVTVRTPDGVLLGLLPLGREGNVVRFAGQRLGADHLDVVALPDQDRVVATAAFEALREAGVRRAELDHVREDGAIRALLHDPRASFKFSEHQSTIAHEVVGEGSFDSYLEARYSRKARQRFRRRLRAFEGREGARFESLNEPGPAAGLLDRLMAVHDDRDGESTFATAEQRQFHGRLIPKLAAEGRLFSWALVAEGKDLAIEYGFRMGGRLYGYQSGKAPDDVSPSPGTLALYLVFRDALFGSAAGVYDFLDGDEEYKARWKTHTRRLYDIGVDFTRRRGSVRGALGALRTLLKEEVKRRLGRGTPPA